MTRVQLKKFKKLKKALKVELENFKSSRRREIAHQGLIELGRLIKSVEAREETLRKKQRGTVRGVTLSKIEGKRQIKQHSLLRLVREQRLNYQLNPNFASYFGNVMSRIRDEPPLWLSFEKQDGKWVYWDNRKKKVYKNRHFEV